MPTITEFIRLGLTKDLLKQVRTEAKKQKISANELIRVSIQEKLKRIERERFVAGLNPGKERS